MRTRLVLLTVPLALAAVAAAPSLAAPKPITGSYTASSPVAGAGDSCAGTVPQSLHLTEVKLPSAGTFKVDLTGYLGDWDLFVLSGGRVLGSAESGGLGGAEDASEKLSIKIKRAATVSIGACNWAGGPTGDVSYVFTGK